MPRRIIFPFEVTLSDTNVHTVVEVTAPAQIPLDVVEFFVSGAGTVAGDNKVNLDLIRYASTGTGTANTGVKANPYDSGTIQSTSKHTLTVEGGSPTVIKPFQFHPQQSLSWAGRQPVQHGTCIGLRCLKGAAPGSLVVRGYIEVEE